MSKVLGIDPGLTGALALYDTTDIGNILVWDMPRLADELDIFELNAIIAGHQPIQTAYLEKVGPRPADGRRQAWRFSHANTAAKTVVLLLNIPLVQVTPTVWKKSYGIKTEARGKPQARRRAMQMFPRQASKFSRLIDSGRAEAALLAVYGARQEFHGPAMKAEALLQPVTAEDLFKTPCTLEHAE